MGPDEELLGVVVHSGLILARGTGAVVALRRITAFPAGLSLDATVLARDVHAEAARRREREAIALREAEAAAKQEDEATAQQETEAAAEKEGQSAAERAHARKQAMIQWQHLPRFGEGDTLRLAVLIRGGATRWLDAYQSASSSRDGRYRLEASYWAAPLPDEGLLTLACAWPEIGLPETQSDVVLPDLEARAAETRPLWTSPQDL